MASGFKNSTELGEEPVKKNGENRVTSQSEEYARECYRRVGSEQDRTVNEKFTITSESAPRRITETTSEGNVICLMYAHGGTAGNSSEEERNRDCKFGAEPGVGTRNKTAFEYSDEYEESREGEEYDEPDKAEEDEEAKEVDEDDYSDEGDRSDEAEQDAQIEKAIHAEYNDND